MWLYTIDHGKFSDSAMWEYSSLICGDGNSTAPALHIQNRGIFSINSKTCFEILKSMKQDNNMLYRFEISVAPNLVNNKGYVGLVNSVEKIAENKCVYEKSVILSFVIKTPLNVDDEQNVGTSNVVEKTTSRESDQTYPVGIGPSSVEHLKYFHRMIHPQQQDILYSDTPSEQSSKYEDTKNGFSVSADFVTNSIPIYQCWYQSDGGRDHFLSQDPNCENTNKDGMIGYVGTQPGGWATKPLYRCYGKIKSFNRHLITTNESDCSSLKVELILGYVPNS